MKYAIISDIHGNAPALEAVLADSKKHNVDKYLFLGDYATIGVPLGNEVVDIIRNLENIVIVRGNHEDYLATTYNQDQEGMLDDKSYHEQYKPLLYAYRALSKVNLEFLPNLPKNINISDNGLEIYLSHSSNIFYRGTRVNYFHSSHYRDQAEIKPFTHKEYLELAKEEALSREDVVEDINKLPDGVYLFGHNHLQFNMQYKGKIFINPGSCGLPLDCNKNAPYTILEVNNRTIKITERRVEYKIDDLLKRFKNSEFYSYTPIWGKIIERQLLTSKDTISLFIRHVLEIAQEAGCTTQPVNNEIWDIAVESFDFNKFCAKM
ncbi:MAG: metallophosphatase family protein [Defluviitaleaceae bacterium]|nr:metallophosphatase family protein [Defluviitaleaceae bacterium]